MIILYKNFFFRNKAMLEKLIKFVEEKLSKEMRFVFIKFILYSSDDFILDFLLQSLKFPLN